MTSPERQLEDQLIEKLRGLKYEYRPDIRDRASLEKNFREKFEALNRVRLTDGEFSRLLDEIITPDVFTAARTLRERNSFTRDDGKPLNFTLVNIKDWCKNTFEVVNQLRINTDNIASEQKLMMMRPYQVYAVKAIVDCIHQNCGHDRRPAQPRNRCPANLRGRHPATHDLRWRATQRPHGSARPWLESPQPGRTRPHGRFAPPSSPNAPKAATSRDSARMKVRFCSSRDQD